MFTPSLIAMMHQSLASSVPGVSVTPESTATHTQDFSFAQPFSLVQEMRQMLKAFKGDKPSLPVVAYSGLLTNESKWFPDITSDNFDNDTMRFFWGNIPLNELIEYFAEFSAVKPDQELFDLGTPLRRYGSNSFFDEKCASLLAQTGQQAPTVSVAIVDRGKTQFGQTPDDYNGRLRHAITKDVILDEHAEQVLSVLLDRLNQHGILPETLVSCALVTERVKKIGRACFRHANSVEMLDALKALRKLIVKDKLPTAINISLGTHVGPHNGDSPLEEYATRLGNLNAHRFVHAAAGNDGLSGVAAVRQVRANEREFFRINLERACTDILVEFWWHDPKPSEVEMEVTLLDGTGQNTLTKLWIDSKTLGRTLRTTPHGFGQVVVKSLFRSQCRNKMNCIAFALSTAKGLPALNLQFGVKSSYDVVMHAWIVVCEKARAMFVEGSSSATIMVPASAPGVMSVAGVDDNDQPWAQSSRGPSIVYQSGLPPHLVPSMAHRAGLGALGKYGTSFASPRACGDSANAIRDPQRLKRCQTILDLLCESYGLNKAQPPPWSPRIGFKAVS